MPARIQRSVYTTNAVFGAETHFTGDLRFSESLNIKGFFRGSIYTEGFLLIEQSAEVIANICAKHLVVAGKLKGDVQVSERVEIHENGQIMGSIQCPSITVAPGANYVGSCLMLADSVPSDIFSTPVDRLKNSISFVK